MLIVSCYIGFFNVRREWQSLNTRPRFYLRLIRRTGWLWIYTSRTTDGRPFKPKKLSVPFQYHGIPAGLTRFRGLGRTNLVPILPPAHPLGRAIYKYWERERQTDRQTDKHTVWTGSWRNLRSSGWNWWTCWWMLSTKTHYSDIFCSLMTFLWWLSRFWYFLNSW
jgi:hypothetical protein